MRAVTGTCQSAGHFFCVHARAHVARCPQFTLARVLEIAYTTRADADIPLAHCVS